MTWNSNARTNCSISFFGVLLFVYFFVDFARSVQIDISFIDSFIPVITTLHERSEVRHAA